MGRVVKITHEHVTDGESCGGCYGKVGVLRLRFNGGGGWSFVRRCGTCLNRDLAWRVINMEARWAGWEGRT